MRNALSKVLSFPGTRIGRWVVIVAWLVLIGAIGPVAGKLEQVTSNEQSSWLPQSVESVKALKVVDAAQKDETLPTIIVYDRTSGLTAADKKAIQSDIVALSTPPTAPKTLAKTEIGGRSVPAVSPQPVFSKDGQAAIVALSLQATGEGNDILDSVDQIRKVVHEGPPGLAAKVTGGGGFSADAIKVFGGIDSTLLLATLALVFVLLIIIYRSPIFWAIPLFTVIFAEVATRGVAYLFAKNGLTLNGQSTGIMSVLVFGAGTDYALLLVARYREELRRHESKFDAMHIALTKAGPAIVASAGTVILALLCLTLAEVNGTKGLGPSGAIGVAMAMLAMLTLLPALLVIFGRKAFWPFIPRVGDEGTDETHGAWRSLGERVMKRPRTVWIATLAGLLVLCAGMTQFSTNLTQGNSFRGEVESVQGQEIISKSFPAGSSAPMNVVVTDPAKVAAVREKLASNKAVIASIQAPAQQLTSGQNTVFDATLVQDPYSPKAFSDVQSLRDQLAVDPQIGKGAVLIGGSSALEYDLREANIRDNWLIMPLVLVVVFVILALLLRALVLPLMLVGTVIVSFFAALGTGALVFEWVFDFPGSDPSLLLLSFIFLVALGVDYNIFLMARTREETQEHGTRMGMLRGLAVTGSVITSAGIVLAGTFAVLGVLPVVYLTQIGFVIAFGVLLDTLIVRSVLVPALVFDTGKKIWWPSALAKRDEPTDGGGDEPEALDELERAKGLVS
ncbi:MAG: MMPL family transporter [Actinomycetes bacterium]